MQANFVVCGEHCFCLAASHTEMADPLDEYESLLGEGKQNGKAVDRTDKEDKERSRDKDRDRKERRRSRSRDRDRDRKRDRESDSRHDRRKSRSRSRDKISR